MRRSNTYLTASREADDTTSTIGTGTSSGSFSSRAKALCNLATSLSVTEIIKESSIKFAMCNLPGVFDPTQLNAHLSLPRNDHYDDQCFSPMLHEALYLLGHNFGDGGSEILLDRVMRTFGKEFCRPTLATIMAMILVSLYLSEQRSFGPSIVQDLLGKSG